MFQGPFWLEIRESQIYEKLKPEELLSSFEASLALFLLTQLLFNIVMPSHYKGGQEGQVRS
jgi:hypothetical protein